MARTGVTYEDVELAAEEILQEDLDPTIERIRHLIGTGSNTTISRYLKEWRSKRLKATTHGLSSLRTPSDPVNEAVKRVWQQMSEENEEKIKAIEIAAEEKIQHIQLEKEEAFKELHKRIDETQTLRDALKKEQQARTILEREHLDAKQLLAVTQGKLTILQESFISHITLSEKLLDDWQRQQVTLKNSHEAALDALQQQHAIVIDDLKIANESNHHKLLMEISRLQEQLFQKDKETLEIRGFLEAIFNNQENEYKEQTEIKQILQSEWSALSQSQREWGNILVSKLEEIQHSLNKRLDAEVQEKQNQLDLFMKKFLELKAITTT